MFFEQLASMFAGLGFFLAGLKTIGDSFSSLATSRLKSALRGQIGTPWRGFGWGLLCGALTQTATVPVFVLGGLMANNLITMAAASPVIIGTNIGTTALIYISTFNIEPIVLLITGIAGTTLVSKRLRNWSEVSKVVFGICLLFVGLYTLQEGAITIADKDWLGQFIGVGGNSFVVAFIAGVVLRVLLQSGTAVTVLAITLFSSGTTSAEQTVMTIYGVNFGAAISTWLLSLSLRGSSREIVNYQIQYDVVGVVILIPLFYIEYYFDIPIVIAFVSQVTTDPAYMMATVYLLFNLVAAATMICTLLLKSPLSFFAPAGTCSASYNGTSRKYSDRSTYHVNITHEIESLHQKTTDNYSHNPLPAVQSSQRVKPKYSGRPVAIRALGVMVFSGAATYYYLTQSVADTSAKQTYISKSMAISNDASDSKLQYQALVYSAQTLLDKKQLDKATRKIEQAKASPFADAQIEALLSKSKHLNSYLSLLDQAERSVSDGKATKLDSPLSKTSNPGYNDNRLEAFSAKLKIQQLNIRNEAANQAIVKSNFMLHLAKAEHQLSLGNLTRAKAEIVKAAALGLTDKKLDGLKFQIFDAEKNSTDPLGDSDVAYASLQFELLTKAIELNNLKAISFLTQLNPNKQTLFTNLFYRYLEIEASIKDISTQSNSKIINATLQLESMRLPNGNIAYPPSSYGVINLSLEKKGNGWSQINW